VALTHYNFCRVHQTLRVTPAMEAGLADHVWGIEELVALLDYNCRRMTCEQAREIAKAECARRGWPWPSNVSVRWRPFTYSVWGRGGKGGNLSMRIRKRDGVILRAGISPL
jgi:hypothetical protein